jgi:hypothetical protein
MGKYAKVEGKLIAEVERYPVLSTTKINQSRKMLGKQSQIV